MKSSQSLTAPTNVMQRTHGERAREKSAAREAAAVADRADERARRQKMSQPSVPIVASSKTEI